MGCRKARPQTDRVKKERVARVAVQAVAVRQTLLAFFEKKSPPDQSASVKPLHSSSSHAPSVPQRPREHHHRLRVSADAFLCRELSFAISSTAFSLVVIRRKATPYEALTTGVPSITEAGRITKIEIADTGCGANMLYHRGSTEASHSTRCIIIPQACNRSAPKRPSVPDFAFHCQVRTWIIRAPCTSSAAPGLDKGRLLYRLPRMCFRRRKRNTTVPWTD